MSSENIVRFITEPSELNGLKSGQTFSYKCIHCNEIKTIKRFDKRDLQYYLKFTCKSCNIRLTRKRRIDEYVHINKPSDIDNFACDQMFEYNCVQCGSLVKVKQYHPARKQTYYKMLCASCSLTKRELRTIHVKSIDELRDLYAEQDYAFNCISCGKLVCSKKIAGKGNLLKGKETTLMCHHCNLSIQNEKHPEWQEKSLQNNKKNHGGVLNLQTKEFRDNIFEKYGTYNVYSKYLYDGVSFDSAPELALWIYAKDHGEDIEREPIRLEFEFNGSTKHVTPDFKYNDKLIEIKGSQFFKDRDKTKEMVNPYNNSYNDLYEAKHRCELDHNVEFWCNDDYKKYIDYVNVTYGSNYIKLYKLYGRLTRSMFVLDSYSYTPYNADMGKEFQNPVGIGITPFDVKT